MILVPSSLTLIECSSPSEARTTGRGHGAAARLRGGVGRRRGAARVALRRAPAPRPAARAACRRGGLPLASRAAQKHSKALKSNSKSTQNLLKITRHTVIAVGFFKRRTHAGRVKIELAS